MRMATKVIVGLLGLSAVVLVVADKLSPPELAYHEPPPKSSAEESSAAQIAIRLKSAMRNPASFELLRVLIMQTGTKCYEYRAQNGFGGLSVEHAVATGDKLHAGAEEGEAAWSSLCRAPAGRDATEAVRAIIPLFEK